MINQQVWYVFRTFLNINYNSKTKRRKI
jgi:hypothetical protein